MNLPNVVISEKEIEEFRRKIEAWEISPENATLLSVKSFPNCDTIVLYTGEVAQLLMRLRYFCCQHILEYSKLRDGRARSCGPGDPGPPSSKRWY